MKKPLFCGDEVRALKVLDDVGANVQPGELGVVFEAGEIEDGRGPDSPFIARFGPLVRWHSGTVCNVYDGDVEVVDRTHGRRPTVKELVAVFIGDDPDLGSSDCACCEGKRAIMAQLQKHGLM